MRWRNIVYVLLLWITSLSAVFLSMVLALGLRNWISSWTVNFQNLLHLLILELLLFSFIAAYRTVYIKRIPLWMEIKELDLCFLLSFLFLFAILALTKMMLVSRLFLAIWMFVGLGLIPLLHYIVKRLMIRFQFYRDNIIIIGANDVGRKAAEYILKEPTMGYNLVGFLDDEKVGEEFEVYGKTFKVISRVRKFNRIAKVFRIGAFMVALPNVSEERLVKLINEIHCISRKVLLVPPLRGLALFNAEIVPPFMNDLLLVNLKNNLLYFHNKVFKRSLDLIGAILAGMFFFPLFCIIAILIKVSSPGPVFYKQRRLGVHGREFWVYKFRTMYKDADKRLHNLLKNSPQLRKEYETSWKLKNDPRVTPIGRLLRRFSLDELPQLLNVLKGDMSLVGPRPYLPGEKKFLKDVERIIFTVRPGITGLWQVSGRSDTDWRFRMETDLWYVLNWSLWLDVMILIKTIWVVFRGKGAY